MKDEWNTKQNYFTTELEVSTMHLISQKVDFMDPPDRKINIK